MRYIPLAKTAAMTVLALGALPGISSSTWAEPASGGATAGSSDPAAVKLLNEAQDVLLSMHSFSADFTETGGTPEEGYAGKVTLLKPKFLRFERWKAEQNPATGAWEKPAKPSGPALTEIVYDGSKIWNLRDGKLLPEKEHPGVTIPTAGLVGFPWAGFFSHIQTPGYIPVKTANPQVKSRGTVAFDGRESVDGVACRKVLVRLASSGSGTIPSFGEESVYDIGDDGIIHRVSRTYFSGDRKLTVVTTLSHIVRDEPALGPSAFRYVPPAPDAGKTAPSH